MGGESGSSNAARDSSLRPRLVLALAGCCALALLAWVGSLRGGLSFDDREAIQGNPVVAGSAPWWTAFQRSYWAHLAPAGHYRPLATLSLRADFALHGDDAAQAWRWHASNVALHVAVVLAAALAFVLLGPWPARRGARGTGPWLGLAVFAVHPALADAVAWISGRSSMLCALPGALGCAALAALWVPRRAASAQRLLATATCCALALFAALAAKEEGWIFAVALPLVAARGGRGAALAALGGSCVAALAVGALRASVLGSPWPHALHAPLAALAWPERLAFGGRALFEAARLFVWPLDYPPNYDRSAAFSAGAWHGASWWACSAVGWTLWLVALATSARTLALSRDRGARLRAWSALLLALSFLPYVQVVPAGAVFAPRFLYLPLLLGVPLWQAGLTGLARALAAPRAGGTGLVRGAALLALALAIGLAQQRSRVYASRASYQLEILRHRPDDAPAWNDLGLAREEQGDRDGARAAFRRSTELDARFSRPWNNLGRLDLADGDLDRALREFERAVELGPRNPLAHVNLGTARLRGGDGPAAEAACRRATELAPGLAAAWTGLARALERQGRASEAGAARERARRILVGGSLAGPPPGEPASAGRVDGPANPVGGVPRN